MEFVLSDRQMNILASKVASIVVKKMRGERIDEPVLVSCKDAAAIIGWKPDTLRKRKEYFTYTKLGSHKQGGLYFDRNKLIEEFNNIKTKHL